MHKGIPEETNTLVQTQKTRTGLRIAVGVLVLLLCGEAAAYIFTPDLQRLFHAGTTVSPTSPDHEQQNVAFLANESTGTDVINNSVNALLNAGLENVAPSLSNSLTNMLVNAGVDEAFRDLLRAGCVFVFYPDTPNFGPTNGNINLSSDQLAKERAQCLTTFTQQQIDRDHDIALQDNDADGLNDLLEEVFSTDPLKVDTDDDGYSDLTELMTNHNPLMKSESSSPLDNVPNPAQ